MPVRLLQTPICSLSFAQSIKLMQDAQSSTGSLDYILRIAFRRLRGRKQPRGRGKASTYLIGRLLTSLPVRVSNHLATRGLPG